MMLMEFQAIDAVIPPGHGIRLVLTDSGEDYLAPLCGNSCPIHVLSSTSNMIIPVINVDKSQMFITPQSADAANNL